MEEKDIIICQGNKEWKKLNEQEKQTFNLRDAEEKKLEKVWKIALENKEKSSKKIDAFKQSILKRN